MDQAAGDPKMEPPPPEPPPGRFYRQLNVAALSLLLFVLLVYLLQLFATVLQQLFTAAFIAYLIVPAHRLLVRRGFSPITAYVLIIIAVVAGGTGLGLMVRLSFEDLTEKLPIYEQNWNRLVHDATATVPWLNAERIQTILRGEATTVDQGMALLRSALSTFAGFFSQVIVVLVFLAFLLAELESFPERIVKAFDPGRAQDILSVMATINRSIAQYLIVKTLMSFLTGVLTWLVLVACDVDYAFLFAVVAFLLNYIPYLGSVVATVLPVLLSLVQFQGPGRAVVVLILLLIVQNLIAYVIEPRTAGKRLNLSPLVIIVALAFWGSLWGIVGMILAVPLVVVIKAVLENIPATRPIGTLLSNV